MNPPPSRTRCFRAWIILLGLSACAGVGLASEVILSEIMYHPAGDKPEYVEIQNLTANPLDIAEWRFVQGVEFVFPAFSNSDPTRTFFKPFERILLSPVDEAGLRTAYPSIPADTRIYGPYTNLLSNAGETIELQDKNGVTVHRLGYDDRAPWPATADGTGHSLVVVHPDRVEDHPSSWRASYAPDGTPGEPPGMPGSLHGALHFSEIAFSTSNTVAWAEIYSSGADLIGATALWIASDRSLSNKVSLTGALTPKTYASWDVDLPLDGNDATLYLVDDSGTVLDAAVVEQHRTRPFAQTFPAGSSEWYSASSSTRDSVNDPDRTETIVIHEIMADPLSGMRDGEYLELYNKGPDAVDLNGWSLEDAVSYTLPPGTTLAPGEYLAVAANRDFLLSAYGAISCVGDFEGQLSNDGETIRLLDDQGNLADEVHYRFEGDWPRLARGLGSSLELLHPDLDNRHSSAWMDSHEADKGASHHFSLSGTYQDINPDPGYFYSDAWVNELHLFLVGDAHVELENITFRTSEQGSPNLIRNGDRMSNNGNSGSGWLAQGTHWASTMDNGVLHLIADGHGDNKANRAEIDLTSLVWGRSYTISFDARWVYGKPRLIAQTWDHSVGGTLIVPPPINLGTPGAPNSQSRANPPPLVESLLHQPAVPSTLEPVVVTALVKSETPLASVDAVHRADSVSGTGSWTRSPMYDDGIRGGDLVAGDGLYTATVSTHQVNRRIVQFYVEAQTTDGEVCLMPRDGEARPAMWMVDRYSTVSALRSMRFILSEYDRDALGTAGASSKFGYRFPRLSNHYFNMTMIANEKDIYYGGEIRKSGSPWTRSSSNGLDRGKWKLPHDRPFRGRIKFMFDNDASTGNREKNRLVRYWLYLFGHPINESEIVQHRVNSLGSRLCEEVEPVAQDLIERNFKDGARGELYRIDDEWWFRDNWDRRNRNADWGYKGTDETIRYHTEWMARSRETDYDYTAFINWTQSLDDGGTSEQDLGRFADPVMMCIMAAVRGYVDDWDSLTLNRGKNGYFYRRPEDGRFLFLHWDSDLAFRNPSGGLLGGLPGVQEYYLNHTNHLRLLLHYLGRMIDDYTRYSTRVNTWLDLEDSATAAYDANVSTFRNWFTSREPLVRQALDELPTFPLDVVSGDGSSLTTPADTVTLQGIAPTIAFSIEAEGHPEAVLTWTSIVEWRLEGIRLRAGQNDVVIQAVDGDGRILLSTPFTVFKTGNAAPIPVLDANPGSWHVEVTEDLTVDVGDSWDPEGTPLTFAWDLDGPADASLALNSAGDRAACTFSAPGLYTLTVGMTDGDAQQALVTREVAVYGVDGFSSFTEPVLPPMWEPNNVELQDGYAPEAYYALRDLNGFLLVHVQGTDAKPLTFTGYRHPWVSRPLPPTNDWLLQTKLRLDTRQFGSFQTGLLTEVRRARVAERYAFSLQGGDRLQVEMISGTGVRRILATQAWIPNQAPLRIRREGDELLFDVRHPDDTWAPVHRQPLLPGTLAWSGGLFTATDRAESLRTAFDYAMLIDIDSTVSPYAGLAISEIMYDPPGGSDYEYLELVNLGVDPIDLTGVRFVEGNPFDELTLGAYLLAPGARALIVNHTDSMVARYGGDLAAIVAGEWAGGKLSNSGERITLVDPTGRVILSMTYDVDGRWPDRASDERGSSLEVIDPIGDLDDPANWRAGVEYLGSPGTEGAPPGTAVVLNEILTHTDPPLLDTIEIHNATDTPANIGGWYLSDSSADYRKYRIPDDTVIPPHGFVTFDERHFNPNGAWNPNPGTPGPKEFGLSSKGDDVYLVRADGSGQLLEFADHGEVGPAQNGVSFGRYLNSRGTVFLTRQTQPTLGDPNAEPWIGPIVITEIMYHPQAGGMEFIELQNIASDPIPLFNPAIPSNTWTVSGTGFSFPEDVTLNPYEVVLLVGGDPDHFRTIHAIPPYQRVFGPFPGVLQDDGERLSIRFPDNPDPGEVDPPWITLDAVRYERSTPWPVEPDGLGPSLERIDVTAFAQDPANWQESPTLGGTPGVTTLPPTTPLIQPSTYKVDVDTAEFDNPQDRAIDVWNSGIDTLTFSVSDDADWLTVSPVSGTSTGTNDVVSLTLSFATAALPGGRYTATIRVSDPQAFNSPFSIPVRLDVQEPVIQVSDASLFHAMLEGLPASPLSFRVFNEGGAETRLDYAITDDVNWLSVAPSDGVSADESDAVVHQITFDASSLTLGLHQATITVTDTTGSAGNSPLEIPLRLDVVRVGAEPEPPMILDAQGALLIGRLSNTLSQATSVRFYYGASDGGSDPDAWDAWVSQGDFLTDGLVSIPVDNLLYGVLYHYRIRVENSLGQSWSTRAETFLTRSPGLPPSPGLRVQVYDEIHGSSLLDPIENLLTRQPSGQHLFDGEALSYDSFEEFQVDYPSLTDGEGFCVVWQGVIYVSGRDQKGSWTLGTASDDGSVWYIDWNRDGDFADPGELVLDNNGSHERRERTATVDFPSQGASCYPTLLAMYEGSGAETMEARLAKGANLPYSALDILDGSLMSTQVIRQTCGGAAIVLQNTSPGSVYDTSATVQGRFYGQSSVFDISVLHGPDDGGADESAWAVRQPVGVFTNTASVDLVATLRDLTPDTGYYYTFLAENAAETLWAIPGSVEFQTRPPVHTVEILSSRIVPGQPIEIRSSGEADWDIRVEYTTDDLTAGPAVLWLPLTVLSSEFSDGETMATVQLPPDPLPDRFFLRISNVPQPQ